MPPSPPALRAQPRSVSSHCKVQTTPPRPGSTSPDVVATNPLDMDQDITNNTATEAAAIEAPPLTPRERTALALETLVSVDYHDTPLSTIHDAMREQTGINIMVNWRDLEIATIDQDTSVTLQLDNVSARTVLDYTMQQAGANAFDDDKPGYRVREGVLDVARLRALKIQVATRIYNIRPLLASRATLLAQFESQLISSIYSDDLGEGGGGLFGGGNDVPDFTSAPNFDLNEAISNVGPRSARNGANSTAGSAAPPRCLGRVRRPRPIANASPSKASPRRDKTPAQASPAKGAGSSAPTPSQATTGFPSHAERVAQLQDYIRQTTGYSISPEDFPSQDEQIDSLINLIQDNVGDYDEWLDDDSTVREINGQLVIKSTLENHDAIAALLDQLQTQGPPEIGAMALAQDPERIEALAEMIAHDVELNLIAVREREQQRDEIDAWNRQFTDIHDNPFHLADLTPLSTFSVDVDTASYTIIRRAWLEDASPPPPAVVRIEEMINYFDYDYEAPHVNVDLLDDGLLTTAALERPRTKRRDVCPVHYECRGRRLPVG